MLTTAQVRELKPRDKMYEVTCAAVAGFVVRVLPSGKKVFLVRRQVDGKYRREKIGPLGPSLGVDEARRRALLMLAGDAHDEVNAEPAVRRSEPAPARSRSVARRSAPPPVRQVEPVKPPEPARLTVRDLAERYTREFIDVYLKDSSAFNYRRHLELDILPVLGDRDFESITRADAQALHARLRKTPGSANYVLCILGSLYTRIIDDWELSDMRHPTAGVKRFKINTRERFLTPEERQRIQDATEAGLRTPSGRKGHLEPRGVWALQLLALTGLRRSEICDLTWPMVDWQHACLRLPDTKTGHRIVHISTQVVALLRHIHDQTGSPRRGRVVGSRTGERLVSINRTWATLRKAIDIPDVRLHDLRHSFASDALMGGVPLAVVGEMLGHRQPNTTKRYAHLANSVVRDAVEFTATRIVAAGHTVNSPSSTPFAPLRDDQWARIAPLVDAHRPRGGKPVELRRIVDGIRWVLHSKARWRDMPAIYGKSTTCWRWYNRWCEDGTWPTVEATITALSAR